MTKAMIWGANGGIGRALVTRLTSQGWTVMAVARQPSDLASLTPHLFEADIADPIEIQATAMAASEITDDINLWIYTVGDITTSTVADMSPDTWQRILHANLTGAFLSIHYSLPLLAPNAHLVFLGAVSEQLRLPGLAAYATAKAGLEAFGDTLGKEERKRRVTVVRPGAVGTPLWEKVPMQLPTHALSAEEVAKQILEAYHQGHQGLLDLP